MRSSWIARRAVAVSLTAPRHPIRSAPMALKATTKTTPTAAMAALHAGGPGLFRVTRTNLFLPAQLGRLVAAVGLVLGQAFLSAYLREKRRVAAAEEEEGASDGGASGGAAGACEAQGARPMSALEAVQILGVDRQNPSLLVQFSPAAMKGPARAPVLTLARDREVARENFEKMFGLATKHENYFLAGKLSAAFRVCVDPNWDDVPAESSPDGAGASSSEAEVPPSEDSGEAYGGKQK